MENYIIPEDHPVFGKSQTIIRVSDGAAIPMSESNSDYQAYLKWLENPNADWTEPQLTKF